MDNSEFKKLLSGGLDLKDEINKWDASEKSKKVAKKRRGDDTAKEGEEGGAASKKKRYRKGKLVEEKDNEVKYRDRAEERRVRGGAKEYDQANRLLEAYNKTRDEEGEGMDMSMFLGGEEQYTHLVKGLDRGLANKERERIYGKDSRREDEDEDKDEDEDEDDLLVRLPSEAGLASRKKMNMTPPTRSELRNLTKKKADVHLIDSMGRYLSSTIHGQKEPFTLKSCQGNTFVLDLSWSLWPKLWEEKKGGRGGSSRVGSEDDPSREQGRSRMNDWFDLPKQILSLVSEKLDSPRPVQAHGKDVDKDGDGDGDRDRDGDGDGDEKDSKAQSQGRQSCSEQRQDEPDSGSDIFTDDEQDVEGGGDESGSESGSGQGQDEARKQKLKGSVFDGLLSSSAERSEGGAVRDGGLSLKKSSLHSVAPEEKKVINRQLIPKTSLPSRRQKSNGQAGQYSGANVAGPYGEHIDDDFEGREESDDDKDNNKKKRRKKKKNDR